MGDRPITTWEAMKHQMQSSFLPYRSGLDCDNVTWLSPNIRRNFIILCPEMLATKYVVGLRTKLQDKPYGFYFSSPDQVIPKTEEFEAQLVRIARWSILTKLEIPHLAAPTNSTWCPQHNSSWPSTRNQPPQSNTSQIANKGGNLCYKCQKPGHLASNCLLVLSCIQLKKIISHLMKLKMTPSWWSE